MLCEGNDQDFAQWQSHFTRAAADCPGFVSLEIIPAFPGAPDWRVIQRFESESALAHWQSSAARADLLGAVRAMSADRDAGFWDEVAPDFHSLNSVTEVITTDVEPGQEVAFQSWAERMQAHQSTFPGYMGTLIQAPIMPAMPYWTTLVRFSTPAQLEAWLASEERASLLQAADPRVQRWKSRRLNNPFGGWFPAEPNAPPPAAWKQTCLVLLVLFPVVMLEIRFLMPRLAHAPLAISTFIGNAISVSLVSWPLMKLAIASLGWWLNPNPQQRLRMEVLGIGTIVLLYVFEIMFFWAL
ncbi:antibiotic biosynthesis monooxygenase [Acidisoma sp. 7E03]